MDTVVTKRLYEGMFLVDSAIAWDQVTGRITTLLEKYEGNVTDLKKWDERRLAYEIKGKNRGLYVLVYFEMPTGMLHELERDIHLSEDIMRAMILRTDAMTEEDLQRPTPAMAMAAQEQAERDASEAAQDSDDSDQNEDSDDEDSDDEDSQDDFEDADNDDKA